MKRKMLKEEGFTLIELMVVVAIVAILAGIAIPSYQAQVRKTYRKDAMASLQGLAQAMERFYGQNNTYSGAAGSQSAPTANGSPWVFPAVSPTDGVARYNLTVNGTATGYTLQATPIAGSSQDGDGIIRLDNTGLRGRDRNGDGDTSDSGEATWSD